MPAKLAAKDPGLWGPAAEPVAATRLGWLDAPDVSRGLLGEFAHLAERVRQDRLDHIVLAGMGGSSLAPEVITRTAGTPLTVLDTTDPHQVASALGDRLDRTLVIVSSKSGSTIETDSHRRIYEQALHDLGLTPEEVARRFVVVTDPGSPLEEVARKAGYHVVLADPNVGGRYSALTAFGLTPSAIAGVDVAALLDQAAAVLPALGGDDDNPGLVLGAALGGFAVDGHDKAVLADHDSGISGFGDWAEQLLAESTGKQGLGILPVVVESADAPGFSPGPDIHLVALGSSAPHGNAPTAPRARPGSRGLWTPRSRGRSALSSWCGNTPRRWPAGSSASTRSTSRTSRNRRTTPPPCSPGRATDRCRSASRPSSTAWWRYTQILNGCAAPPTSRACSTPSSGRCQTGVTWRSWPISTGSATATPPGCAPQLAVRTTHPVTFGWGPTLPALDRPVSQGRPADRRVPADHWSDRAGRPGA